MKIKDVPFWIIYIILLLSVLFLYIYQRITISTVLILFILLVLGGYAIIKHENKEKKKFKPLYKSSSEIEIISSYINECLKKKFSPRKIRERLKQVGWKEEIINEAFKKIKSSKR